ncbi:hypothetical protein ACCZ74_12340 [Agrobacterium vitis]|uniref:hypothetical protein n=1 Tax=Agrobacterium vitis TaxID=373 RepID=UPI00403EE331
MAQRTNIIEYNETVLCLIRTDRAFGGLYSYLTETPVIGRPLSDAELLKETSLDDVVMVRRMNIDTWISEDISEEVAALFLTNGLYDLDSGDGFPPYVRDSRAWKLMRDDLEAEQPVRRDPDAKHDDRRNRFIEAAE